jgi:hypothetical protein
MRRIGWIASRAALLIALAARCADNPIEASQKAVAAIDTLAADITSAFCSWQFRCCSMAEIRTAQKGRYSTPSECEQSPVALAVKDELLLLRSAIGEGVMTFDAAKAKACVDAYRNRPCNLPLPLGETFIPIPVELTPRVENILATCPGAFVGLVPDGSRCDMTAHCTPGSRCVGHVSGTGGMPGYYPPQLTSLPTAFTPVNGLGVCSRAQRDGEPCADTTQCDRSANLVCREPEFVCGPPPGQSEMCNVSLVNPEIAENLCDTSKGLTCQGQTRICSRPPGDGQPCTPPGLPVPTCDTNLVCVGATFNGVGICKRPAARGEDCGAQAIPPCASGLACRPTRKDGIGVCDDPPGVGEPCDSSGACANPTLCSFYTRRCTTPGPKHTADQCSSHEECNSLLCDSLTAPTHVCLPNIRPVVCSGSAVTPGDGSLVMPTDLGGGI